MVVVSWQTCSSAAVWARTDSNSVSFLDRFTPPDLLLWVPPPLLLPPPLLILLLLPPVASLDCTWSLLMWECLHRSCCKMSAWSEVVAVVVGVGWLVLVWVFPFPERDDRDRFEEEEDKGFSSSYGVSGSYGRMVPFSIWHAYIG